MKWQRARMTAAADLPGFEFWVEVGPPVDHPEEFSTDALTGKQWIAEPGAYYLSHLSDGGFRVEMRAAVVELLPEFAENVDVASWPRAVAEWRGDGEVRQ